MKTNNKPKEAEIKIMHSIDGVIIDFKSNPVVKKIGHGAHIMVPDGLIGKRVTVEYKKEVEK